MYNITLTDNQMRVVLNCLELYFRPLMGQFCDLADEWVSHSFDLSTPAKKSENFDVYMEDKKWVECMLKGIYRSLHYPEGYAPYKSDNQMIAEDIWDAVRVANGQSRWNFALQNSQEPLPTVEYTEDPSQKMTPPQEEKEEE